jgi:hypothetical protein
MSQNLVSFDNDTNTCVELGLNIRTIRQTLGSGDREYDGARRVSNGFWVFCGSVERFEDCTA